MKLAIHLLFTFVFVSIFVSGCGSGSASQPPVNESPVLPTQSNTPSQTEAEPVFVSALCTLLGKPPETRIVTGSPVSLSWNWMATTPEYVQLFIDKSITTVTFNGQKVANIVMSNIDKLPDREMYLVKWKADVGILTPGTYEITYSTSWSEQITDGVDTYGPGSKVEYMNDRCTLIVE